MHAYSVYGRNNMLQVYRPSLLIRDNITYTNIPLNVYNDNIIISLLHAN